MGSNNSSQVKCFQVYWTRFSHQQPQTAAGLFASLCVVYTAPKLSLWSFSKLSSRQALSNLSSMTRRHLCWKLQFLKWSFQQHPPSSNYTRCCVTMDNKCDRRGGGKKKKKYCIILNVCRLYHISAPNLKKKKRTANKISTNSIQTCRAVADSTRRRRSRLKIAKNSFQKRLIYSRGRFFPRNECRKTKIYFTAEMSQSCRRLD